jgi:hypothetical protein
MHFIDQTWSFPQLNNLYSPPKIICHDNRHQIAFWMKEMKRKNCTANTNIFWNECCGAASWSCGFGSGTENYQVPASFALLWLRKFWCGSGPAPAPARNIMRLKTLMSLHIIFSVFFFKHFNSPLPPLARPWPMPLITRAMVPGSF